MSAKLRVVSWVLLTIVGGLTLLGSLGSVYVAYVAEAEIDQIGPMNLSSVPITIAACGDSNSPSTPTPTPTPSTGGVQGVVGTNHGLLLSPHAAMVIGTLLKIKSADFKVKSRLEKLWHIRTFATSFVVVLFMMSSDNR